MKKKMKHLNIMYVNKRTRTRTSGLGFSDARIRNRGIIIMYLLN